MATLIALILFLFIVTLSLGGGLYEVLVIYPGWKYDVRPVTLRDKLETSGMNRAAKKFWPLVSPLQGLLAIVNIVLAWNYAGEAHAYWLAAAIAIFVTRVVTFSYFIPEMIRKIMKPEQFEATRLQAIVRWWTGLSPLRLVPELMAWVLLIIAVLYFGK